MGRLIVPLLTAAQFAEILASGPVVASHIFGPEGRGGRDSTWNEGQDRVFANNTIEPDLLSTVIHIATVSSLGFDENLA